MAWYAEDSLLSYSTALRGKLQRKSIRPAFLTLHYHSTFEKSSGPNHHILLKAPAPGTQLGE